VARDGSLDGFPGNESGGVSPPMECAAKATRRRHPGHRPPSTPGAMGVPQVPQLVFGFIPAGLDPEQVFHFRIGVPGFGHGHLDLLADAQAEALAEPVYGHPERFRAEGGRGSGGVVAAAAVFRREKWQRGVEYPAASAMK